MHELVSLLASGLIIGFILFQVCLNTPIIFTKLSPENASPVLRTIFPRFFLSIFLFSFISFLLLYINNVRGLVVNVSIATIILSGICYLIIPATNNARDENNDSLFSFYHNVSVFSTLIILVINIISFFSHQVISN